MEGIDLFTFCLDLPKSLGGSCKPEDTLPVSTDHYGPIPHFKLFWTQHRDFAAKERLLDDWLVWAFCWIPAW